MLGYLFKIGDTGVSVSNGFYWRAKNAMFVGMLHDCFVGMLHFVHLTVNEWVFLCCSVSINCLQGILDVVNRCIPEEAD